MADILSEGEAMVTVIGYGESYARDQAEAVFGTATIESQNMALGLLAVCIDILDERPKETILESDLAYYHACLAAFIQGAGVTARLISEGQYLKAAAALKQDYELVTRIHEAVSGCAVEGRQPNVKHAPLGSQWCYGELNKIAHPANLDALSSLLSHRDGGGLSVAPVFNEPAAVNFITLHLWICCEMVGLALELLAIHDAKDKKAIRVIEKQYELLLERTNK